MSIPLNRTSLNDLGVGGRVKSPDGEGEITRIVDETAYIELDNGNTGKFDASELVEIKVEKKKGK